ncbi:MAG: glycosyltransferase family 9 protein [Desulfobacteraceae bacterium]|nr:glycosyltransferase family 9 protein [Desulfobacteraceae bacterium]MBC2718447.1 glycosyltransferase family 9 protein [Desulfobacteraceae bacterium]
MKKTLKNLFFFFLQDIGKRFEKRVKRQIDKEQIRKILIFENGGIGDLLKVFPVIEALMANFPDASISIVVAKPSREILYVFPGKNIFSEIFEFDLKGDHRGILRKLRFILSLRKRNYDMIYVPAKGDGMREISTMAFLSRIPHRIGFKKDGFGSLNTVTSKFEEDIPILTQNLSLLKGCGLNVWEEEIKVKISEDDLAFAHRMRLKKDALPLFVIHPGASWYGLYKMWGVENYKMLINQLLKEFKATVILIGSKDEEEMGKQIYDGVGNPFLIDMTGKTTIPQLSAIIKESDLFIGSDSGPLHIALTVKVPSVAIFGPTSPEQIISPSHRDRCMVVRKKIGCSPCYLHQSNVVPSCRKIRCLKEISVEDVLKAIRKVATIKCDKEIGKKGEVKKTEIV